MRGGASGSQLRGSDDFSAAVAAPLAECRRRAVKRGVVVGSTGPPPSTHVSSHGVDGGSRH